MSTQQNLDEAFGGECKANCKYEFFADKAEKEGYKGVAKYFRAAAAAEGVHARRHMQAMESKTTLENLQAAIEGENEEFQDMYPRFLQEARDEGHKAGMMAFKYAMAVEQVHHSLYREALGKVEQGQDVPEDKIFVCSVCGNTVLHEAPEKCPVCSAKADKFDEIG